MGSTLPLLKSYVTGLGRQVGCRVGRLYASNTLGAVASPEKQNRSGRIFCLDISCETIYHRNIVRDQVVS